MEKIQLKDDYELTEFPRDEFVKYLLDLKVTEALARNNKNIEKADEIQKWFENLEQLLKNIFDDESVRLMFDEDTFEFFILQQGKERFGFNTLSSGYQAVLDIIVDIIMRMQNQVQRTFDFHLPGIVLIDEIETHLHLELQKHIMPLLITVFPNIQFIVTSHSPFILSSLQEAVIFDLENKVLVEHGLDNVPYDGIVEGYFQADKISDILKGRFERYKYLVLSSKLSEDEISEIAELEKCAHCNGIKNNHEYDEEILDCCKQDPEKYLNFLLENNDVRINVADQDDEIQKRTALLITETFSLKNTGMRTYTSDKRLRLLQKEMNVLYKQLEKIHKNPNSKVAMMTIRSLLRHESAFAAFKRCYVREHAAEYPDLQ